LKTVVDVKEVRWMTRLRLLGAGLYLLSHHKTDG
jgi:hypothetical protein